jgi:hypothetical protein
MTSKKSDGKQLARSRLSLASRWLGRALRASLQVPPPEEPWRHNKPKHNRSKRHK